MDTARKLVAQAAGSLAFWRRPQRDLNTADIFCRVVDNFGDAGVAVRLARQLVREHGFIVRLFIDKPETLDVIAPREDRLSFMDVLPWDHAFAAQPAAVVIATFSCRLPAPYQTKMAAKPTQSVWINLEYLSAESWVETHHRLPSKQTNQPLTEYFFYPGFTEKTGGLLRERDVLTRMQRAEKNEVFTLSLFAYPSIVWPALIAVWMAQETPMHVLIPMGALCDQLQLTQTQARGHVTLEPIPFSSQLDYDRLLARCDLNIVRGEDSFVRAQWAAVPFLWHLYPTPDHAHHTKLDAFLTVFSPPATYAALARVLVHERLDALQSAWHEFMTTFDAQRNAALAWRKQLLAQPDCTKQLLAFAHEIETANASR